MQLTMLSAISRCTHREGSAHACKTRGRKLTILNDSFPSLCRGRSSFSPSLPSLPSLYVAPPSSFHVREQRRERGRLVARIRMRILRLRSAPSKYNAAPLCARARRIAAACRRDGRTGDLARARARARDCIAGEYCTRTRRRG